MPATKDRPAAHHEDLLWIFPEGGHLKALQVVAEAGSVEEALDAARRADWESRSSSCGNRAALLPASTLTDGGQFS